MSSSVADLESRLPVGSSAKIRSGRVTSARAVGHALLLAAGQLGGPVAQAVGDARAIAVSSSEPRLVGLLAAEGRAGG